MYLKKDPSSTTLIVLHLGSGASVCAIQNGRSLDTSMGLTPLDGLPGSSRSGSVDPSLIFHYTNDAGKLSHEKTEKMHLTEVRDRTKSIYFRVVINWGRLRKSLIRNLAGRRLLGHPTLARSFLNQSHPPPLQPIQTRLSHTTSSSIELSIS